MKKQAVRAAALVMALLCACGGPGRARGEDVSLEIDHPAEFRRLYSSEVETLNYLVSYSAVDTALTANLVDTLVDYDSYGNIWPGLAENWSANEDMTEWTFHIRRDAAWYDCEGRYYAPVTAEDWVTSARYVNNAANNSTIQYMYSSGAVVEKAQDYYNYTDYLLHREEYLTRPRKVSPGEIGVHALDDYTLVYTLEQPCRFFLSVLSYTAYLPVNRAFLEEQGAAFGTGKEHLLYNGAYILTDFLPMVRHTLTKNPGYWDAENVHLDVVSELFRAEMNSDMVNWYLADVIDYAVIPPEDVEAALAEPALADRIHQSRPDSFWSYFYTFNFSPRFDAAYEPANWAKAVVNENFRHALMAGLDRLNALSVYERDNPELLLNNTIAPPGAAQTDGLDYTLYPPLAEITAGDSFDPEAALVYRDKAAEELMAEGVTFPVKALMPYNPATAGWRQECERVEAQMEGLLGSDFLDIIVEPGPETAFLAETRMSGNYAFMKCRWGADYADPQTWAEPFADDSDYNFWNFSADQKIHMLYEAWASKTSRASLLYDDDEKRYTFFAEAERLIIEHAIAIPFSISSGDGYILSRIDQFEGEYAPYGIASQRYKGYTLHEDSMNMADYHAAYRQWQERRTVTRRA